MKLINNLYVEVEDSDLANLSILYGGRGLGKSFGVMKNRILDSLEEENQKFIWLRDSDEIVKKIAAGKNSIASVVHKTYPEEVPEVIIEKSGTNYEFTTGQGENKYTLGYLMALSTFHNARGLSFDEVAYIVYDEFIPEKGVITRKNQGSLFLNMYETVNRNRELEGKPPVKIIFLSNAEDVYSEILEDLGVSTILEDMVIEGRNEYRDNDIWICLLSSKAFHDAKADTFIYRIARNDQFKKMALENSFTNSMSLIKRKVDLKGCKGLLTLSNRYTLIQLADGSLYFKLASWKGLINYDMDNENEAILYRMLFNDKLRLHYIAGNMFFDSIYTQRRILDLSRF